MAHPHDFSDSVILITDDGLGQAPPEVREQLMRRYLQALLGFLPLPNVICFCAHGVKLTLEGSPVLDLLEQFEQEGVVLLVCAASLNLCGVAERMAIGVIAGMHEIVTAQAEAAKVVTL